MFQSPLSGVLFFIFLAAVPIAFLLNLLVQWLYRRASCCHRVGACKSCVSDNGPGTLPDRLDADCAVALCTWSGASNRAGVWRGSAAHGDTGPDHVTLQFLGLERAHDMPTT